MAVNGDLISDEELDNRYYYRNFFVESFIDFIELVSNAELSDPINPTNEEGIYFRFNGASSAKEYASILKIYYQSVSIELNERLSAIPNKPDKLLYLDHYVIEINLLSDNLIKDSKGFVHKQFKNTSGNQIKEADKALNEYYNIMEEHLKKMELLLTNVRDNIRHTSQEDLSKATTLLPDPISSTVENPLLFFENFITGIAQSVLLKYFEPTKQDFEKDISYNRLSKVITYNILKENGEYEIRQKTFSDFTKKIIIKQREISKGLLRLRISQLVIRDEVNGFLLLMLSNLKRLMELNISHTPENASLATSTLLEIANYINENFSPFFDAKNKNLIAGILRRNILPAPKVIKNNYAFKLNSIYSFELFISKSWGFLVNDYIHSDKYSAFQNVFTGELDEDKIVPIPWLDFKSGNTIKKSLFYLFTQLKEKSIILPETDTDLKNKIAQLFCNNNGSRFSGIHNNYTDFLERPGKHDKIDKLIVAILV